MYNMYKPTQINGRLTTHCLCLLLLHLKGIFLLHIACLKIKAFSLVLLKYLKIIGVNDSFYLCLFNFLLIYQFHSIMTTLVRTTCWNPAELIIWKSFHHHFKRIWWGLLIEIEMQLFLLSLLKYSEMSSQMITFNHFRCHLSYFSSYK